VTIHLLEQELRLPRPLEEVFGFFAAAENLERITPRWLRFSIRSPLPVKMEAGARIRYRLRWRGLPLAWLSVITCWEPPHRFIDEQLSGPYRLWEHEHCFEWTGRETLVRDRVRYSMPGGALIHRFIVRPDLERVFAHRRERLKEIFGPR
jgi:ligand-binding SRPBCC domain-containing protein